VAAAIANLCAGAVVTFTGHMCTEDGVTTLRLEHCPGMTEREISRLVEAAATRWKRSGVSVIHRVGELKPGETIIPVAVAARHRKDAFGACEYLMDQMKTNAPFGKE
jgi:molybdopterin synthase catalytic subunit